MELSTFIQNALVFGIGRRKAAGLYHELFTWVNSSGYEWTVKRLKTLKLITIGAKRVPEESGYLSGYWGSLVLSKEISIVNKINMIHVYLYFVAPEATDTQLSKFYDSMESQDLTGMGTLPRDASFQGMRVPISRLQPIAYVDHPFNTNKSIPAFAKGKNEGDKGDDIVYALNSPIWRWWGSHYPMFPKYLSSEWTFPMLRVADQVKLDTLCVGRIGFIQEPGFKLRAVANPNRFAQWALDPLKGLLLSVLSNEPSDCTHDQEKGIRRVQGWLKQHKSVCSIDLSDATNLFPLKYQLSVLEKLAGVYLQHLKYTEYQAFQGLIDLFKLMCKSPWECSDGVPRKFSRGQPLGLGPSFALFALSHHCVLKDIGINSDDYVILGDDICIAGTALGDKYVNKMNSLGAKVSQEKSLTSKEVAEFAGKIITSKLVISKYKWQPIRSVNVLDILRVHGPKLLALVPNNLMDVVPTLCTLPRYLGGCGFTLPEPWKSMVNPILYQKLIDKSTTAPGRSYVSKLAHYKDILNELHAYGVDIEEIYWSRLSDTLQRDWEKSTIPKTATTIPDQWKGSYITRNDPGVLKSSFMVRHAKRLCIE